MDGGHRDQLTEALALDILREADENGLLDYLQIRSAGTPNVEAAKAVLKAGKQHVPDGDAHIFLAVRKLILEALAASDLLSAEDVETVVALATCATAEASDAEKNAFERLLPPVRPITAPSPPLPSI